MSESHAQPYPTATVLQGDCREVMGRMEAGSVDAVVTDPPYGLEFMGKEWDAPWAKNEGTGEHNAGFKPGAPAVPGVRGEVKSLPSFTGGTNPTCRNCGGTRNGNDRASRRGCRCEAPSFPNTTLPRMRAYQEWCEAWAAECLRVLKPGGHLLAFGGTRTYHRLACAIEDAGFEIRDSLMWLYGSGFPKSHNLRGEWEGWGTALKPAHEPIVVARKPLVGTVAANVLAHGTGALNIDGCRVQSDDAEMAANTRIFKGNGHLYGGGKGLSPDVRGALGYAPHDSGRWPANVVLSHNPECDETCVEGCRVAELDWQSGKSKSNKRPPTGRDDRGVKGFVVRRQDSELRGHDDSGGASRFFYTAKASRKERGKGNDHPTVKPVSLMRWLVRLVTPPNGVVLDPFTGSGTTGLACLAENARFVGIEREPEYVAIAMQRLRMDVRLPLDFGEAVS